MKLKRSLGVYLCSLLLVGSEISLAQGSNVASAGAAQGKKNDMQSRFTPILIGGVIGMALGVSTLSFYGRPQARMGNVAYGTALGIIIGAAYSLAMSASRQFKHLDRRTYGHLSADGWNNLSVTKDLELRDRPWFSLDVASF